MLYYLLLLATIAFDSQERFSPRNKSDVGHVRESGGLEGLAERRRDQLAAPGTLGHVIELDFHLVAASCIGQDRIYFDESHHQTNVNRYRPNVANAQDHFLNLNLMESINQSIKSN